jgi:hypothetical protein
MSLTYGYDLKEGDDMIAAPIQITEILSRLMLPGAAMVNNLPFCEVPFVTITMLAPHGHYFSEVHPFLGAMV